MEYQVMFVTAIDFSDVESAKEFARQKQSQGHRVHIEQKGGNRSVAQDAELNDMETKGVK